MSCERFVDAVAGHAVGAALDRAAAAHLRECPTCRRALDEQRGRIATAEEALRRFLAIGASAELPARVSRRVAERVAAEGTWPVSSRSLWAGVAAAAAVVVILVAADPGRPRVPEPHGAVSGARDSSRGVTKNAIAPPAIGTRARADGQVTPPSPVVREPSESRRRAKGSGGTGGDEPPVVAVLVPPEQARAIARLQELTARGVLDPDDLPPASPIDVAAAELVIPPLVIREIPVPDVHAVLRPAHDATYAP